MPNTHVSLPRLVGLGLLKSESTLFAYSSFFFHVTFRSICRMLVNFSGAICLVFTSSTDVKLGSYMSWSCNDSIEMYKKRDARQNCCSNNQNLLIVSLPFSLLSSLHSLS